MILKDIVFIGGGLNSAVGYAHYCASRMDGVFNLTGGVFSSSKEREPHSQAAQRYNCGYSRTLEELLEFSIEDANALAVVLTPTPTHYETVKALLLADIPVLCEKTLACSSAGALSLQQLAKERNGFLAVVYNYACYPMVAAMRQMVLSGDLGRVLHFQAEMPQEGYLRRHAKPQDWRLRDQLVPSIYLDLMAHLHHLVDYVTGEVPFNVSCRHREYSTMGVVDNAMALATYSNDVQGQFWVSKTALGERNGLRLRVYGTEGSAEWRQEDPECLRISTPEGDRQLYDRSTDGLLTAIQRFKAGHPAGWLEALANLYSMIDVALDEHEVPEMFSAQKAVEGLQLMEAMALSARNSGMERAV